MFEVDSPPNVEPELNTPRSSVTYATNWASQAPQDHITSEYLEKLEKFSGIFSKHRIQQAERH